MAGRAAFGPGRIQPLILSLPCNPTQLRTCLILYAEQFIWFNAAKQAGKLTSLILFFFREFGIKVFWDKLKTPLFSLSRAVVFYTQPISGKFSVGYIKNKGEFYGGTDAVKLPILTFTY